MTDLAGVELPDDLVWTDEWAWSPYAESVGHALDGTLLVDRSAAALAGRPITLAGADDRAWLDRATLDALRDLLGDTSLALTLADGRAFTVGWRYGDGPIEADAIPGSDWHNNVTLRLREV